jgi:phosphoserine aminotransferase
MIFLTPGPTKTQSDLPKWLKEAIDTNVVNLSHRTKWFEDIFAEVVAKLRTLLSIPNDYVIAFTSSATEVWERSIQNLVVNESFHIVNGEFSQRHSNFSRKLGRKNVEHLIDVTFDGSLDEINIPNSCELICFAQNETSTGMMFSNEEIVKLKKKYPNQLVCADIVSAAPSLDLDYNSVDCAYFSVQKGFGLPAGLGVVILSPNAINRASEIEKKQSIGTYHSFLNLAEHASKNQTPETPNVLAIWLLNKTLDTYLSEGISNLRNRVRQQHRHLVSELSKLCFNSLVTSDKYQSRSVVAATTPTSAKEIKSKLENLKILVGGGYGKYVDTAIRIANFPMHTSEEHNELIKTLKHIS